MKYDYLCVTIRDLTVSERKKERKGGGGADRPAFNMGRVSGNNESGSTWVGFPEMKAAQRGSGSTWVGFVFLFSFVPFAGGGR